jgi:hypothetical protein
VKRHYLYVECAPVPVVASSCRHGFWVIAVLKTVIVDGKGEGQSNVMS